MENCYILGGLLFCSSFRLETAMSLEPHCYARCLIRAICLASHHFPAQFRPHMETLFQCFIWKRQALSRIKPLILGNKCKVKNVIFVPSQLKRFGGCAFFSLEKIIGWINLTLQLQNSSFVNVSCLWIRWTVLQANEAIRREFVTTSMPSW